MGVCTSLDVGLQACLAAEMALRERSLRENAEMRGWWDGHVPQGVHTGTRRLSRQMPQLRASIAVRGYPVRRRRTRWRGKRGRGRRASKDRGRNERNLRRVALPKAIGQTRSRAGDCHRDSAMRLATADHADI